MTTSTPMSHRCASESRSDAQQHALWAVATIALMVVGLGIALIVG
ncbi:MAG: hypothetical protein ACKO8I_10970 [Cyanobacteriota bacterium]